MFSYTFTETFFPGSMALGIHEYHQFFEGDVFAT